jgi:ubiquinone biosynthesis protein
MNTLSRAFTITFRVGVYLAWLAAWKLGLGGKGSPSRRFVMLLEGLGTPFVKLGQHLSLRSDLFPLEFVRELQDLQDHVRPFDSALAAREIEAALGQPPAALFARFDAEPFAAASIAQVHGARTYDGREVIVKVRRPDIVVRVDEDMRLLMMLVRALSLVSRTLVRYHAADVVKQVWDNLRRELNLREEARNVRRFADAFAGSTTIMIPDVIDELCREQVMVQQRSGGERVDHLSDPAQGAVLAGNFLDAYVKQFFTLGFFHGDPHPGNLFVMAEGHLCFHDFGIVGTLDRPTRQALAAFMLGFADQDSDWIIDSWLELGMLRASSDREALRPVVAEILADYSRRPLREWSMGAAFMRLVNSSRDRGVAVPLNLLVLARTILLMEATIRMLDANFSLLDSLVARSREVLKVALAEENGGGMRLQYETAIAATEWRRLLATTVRQLRRRDLKLKIDHEGLPDFANIHLKAANRVSLALVTLGLYLAASLLMQHSIGPTVGGVPVLAILGYAAAVWYTIRLVHAVGKGL